MSLGSRVSFSYRLITLRSVFHLQTTWPHPYISRLLPYITSPLPKLPLRAGPEQKMPEGTRLRQINTQPPALAASSSSLGRHTRLWERPRIEHVSSHPSLAPWLSGCKGRCYIYCIHPYHISAFGSYISGP